MWWLNAGVAPVYREYRLGVELRSANGSAGARLGNAEPLALSARKLLWVALHALGLNPDADEEVRHPRRCFSRLVARRKFSSGSPSMVPAERRGLSEK